MFKNTMTLKSIIFFILALLGVPVIYLVYSNKKLEFSFLFAFFVVWLVGVLIIYFIFKFTTAYFPTRLKQSIESGMQVAEQSDTPPLNFIFAVLLVASYCIVFFFAGHSGGFLGEMLLSWPHAPFQWIGWVGVLITLGAPFQDRKSLMFAGPVLLLSSIVVVFLGIYPINEILWHFVFAAPFLIVLFLFAIHASVEFRTQ